MNEPQIYDILTGIFDDIFDIGPLKLTPETTARDIDGWDSLAHIRLIITVEKEFKIKFSASEVGKLEKVGDLVKLIEEHTTPH